MKRFVLISFVICTWCIACSEPEISTLGSIAGVVVDATSKGAISGVKVTLAPGGSSQLTGKDGSFTFEELESQEYTLSFTKDNYESETQKVMVRANLSSNVQVSLSPIQPVLSISTNVLNFGNETSTLAVDIMNSGKGVLKWKVSESVEWITCAPDKGETEKEMSTLVVEADRSRLEQGNYSESFVIGSNGGSATVVVSISVNGIKLSVEPSELDFGMLSNSKQLSLTNTSTGYLRYTASSNRNWLTLSKSNGSITTSDYLTAIVSREGLSAGHYDASIVFSTDGGEVSVPVKMDVAVNETPTVTAESVSDIKYNSALLHGTVVSVGSDRVTRYGFCWSEHTTPTIDDNYSNLGDCTTAEAFESLANNLKSDTKYYYRAYAENSIGLAYSEKTLSFSTNGLPSIPGVATGVVDNVTAATARAKGTLTSLGNVDLITHYGHVWGTSAKPTIENSSHTDLGEANATSSFVSDVTGLSPHTTYYIRAYATNEKGTAYGEDVTFVTSKTVAKVSTSEITEIVHNAATCGGVISDTGGHTITEKGVCYSKSAMPIINDSKQVATTEKDNTFSCRISGLDKETTYYVRAYVKTSDNTVFYGDDKLFKTTKEVKLPTLSAITISNIQTTSATFVGTITSDGNSEITECGFCWSDVSEPTIVDKKVNCEPQSKELGKNVISLEEGTKYFVRSFAKNAMGYAYSNVATFETKAVTVPTLSNTIVDNIGKKTADVSAKIESNGNASVVENGFCWSISPNPSVYDSKRQVNLADDTITAKLDGLPELTTVYVRAYAINSKGIGYGETTSFQTSDSDIDVWDGTIASGFDGGSGSLIDPIQIRTGAQLALLAQKVNSGSTYEDVYFELTSNINLKEKQWTPIGGALDAYLSSGVFKGHFNGQGHSISGIKINISRDCIGLFGRISGAEIKNMSISGKVAGEDYVGLLFGRGVGIINNIKAEGHVEGRSLVGGIGGMLAEVGTPYSEGRLINSSNNSTVTATNGSAGGLLGGETGYNSGGEASVINCVNYGTVKGASGGGIRAASHGGRLENICNYSDVQSGYAIQQGYYYNLTLINCFWINDMSKDFGCELGWKSDNDHKITNCGYFSRDNNKCILMKNDTDLVEELNQWVTDNGEEYLSWHYETIDGYARPALDEKTL